MVSFAPNYLVKQEIQIVGVPDGIRSSFGMISWGKVIKMSFDPSRLGNFLEALLIKRGMLQSKDHYKSSVPVFRKEKEVEIKYIQRLLDSTVSFY